MNNSSPVPVSYQKNQNLKNKISWGYSDQWIAVREVVGVNRPQGNLPNFQYGLTKQAQDKLMNEYLNVMENQDTLGGSI